MPKHTIAKCVSKYIHTLINAKIIYECSRFDMKSKKSLSGEKNIIQLAE